MPSPVPHGQVQLCFRVDAWMAEHLRRRARQESTPLARSSSTAIIRGLILADAEAHPTGADQAAA